MAALFLFGVSVTPEVGTNGAGAKQGPTLTDPTPDSGTDLEALVEQAEAEAAEAEALAAAAAARARAARLRRQAHQHASSTPGPDALEDCSPPTDIPAPRAWYKPRLRRPRRSALVIGLALIIAVAGSSASGYIVWQHRSTRQQHQQAEEFAAAAQQRVVELTSLNFNGIRDDVQHIVDDSTGEFKDDFQKRADDLTKVVQDSKIVTQGTVHATAVQSIIGNSAVVLAAATSQVTNSEGSKDEPRAWRLRLTLTREGQKIKMSKVEFVP